jgi:DNA helicase-2/ATP-dependent DNA helicase PcrA
MTEELLANLNPEQKEAVLHDTGALLILAGAGTGKTMVITRRIARLILENKAKTDEILALTFTDKSAGEMEERIDRLLPYGYTDLWVSTFHAFCERILKQHALDIGLPGDFKLLTETQQWLLIRKNIEKFNLDYYKPLGNPTKFISALLKHFSRAKDELVSPENYLEFAKNLKLDEDLPDADLQKEENLRIEEVANAYHVYQQLLLQNNALDFGDLINYTLKLFEKRKKILDEYRKKFKYILVDEFQDTNLAQYELVKLLSAPKNNLTVVGDDDQSIYKFRGASISNIMQFKSDFPECREIVLNKNYRSRQNILDVSYEFIQKNNPNRLEVKLQNLSKKLISPSEEKGIVEHLHYRSLEEESDGIAQKILEIREASGAEWNDFAILVRANGSASSFVAALQRRGIPYQFFASKGLYGKPVILDTLAWFRLLYDKHDDNSFFRVLNLPMWRISAFDLSLINHEAGKYTQSLFETVEKASGAANILKLQDETIKILRQISAFLEKQTSEAREKTPTEIYLSFLKEIGYYKFILDLSDQDQKEIIGFLNQFYKRIKASEMDSSYRVKDFLDEMEFELEAGDEGALAFDPESGPEMVRIMTVHSAKGLEFDFVFIPNLVDLRFPTTERKEQIPLPDALVKESLPEGDVHLEEERRLFYVAMTRAKKGLFFTSAEDYGGARKKKLSRFLNEIGFGAQGSESSGKFDLKKDITEEKKPSSAKASAGKTAPLPKYFSFTQLTAFANCPMQYKFAHILKVPERGKGVFSFGKTMHNTLHKFVVEYLKRKSANQGTLFGADEKSSESFPIKLEEVLKIYEESWVDEWFNSKKDKEDYKKQGREAVKMFYDKFVAESPKPLKAEEGFWLKIGGHSIKGRADRIDEIDGGVEIVDYKTGKAKEKLEGDDKMQLLIYQLAAEECLGLKPQKLTYYYLNSGQTISFLGKEEDKIKLKEQILAEIEEMRVSEFPADPKSGARTCGNCDYKEICNGRIT